MTSGELTSGKGERPRSGGSVSLLALGGAAIVGAMIALQTRMNGELGRQWGDAPTAALWSFGSGFVLIALISLLVPRGRRGLVRMVRAVRAGNLARWTLLGGAIGGCFVLSQAAVSPLLGVALFIVGVVAGQSLGGVVTDRWGIGPGGPRPITAARAIGAVVMIAAVGWSASAGLTTDAPVVLLLIPTLVGFAMSLQQAGNGRIGAVSGTSLVPTVTNFAGGTLFLFVCALLSRALLPGSSEPTVSFDVPWWTLLGGAVGLFYIGGSAVLVARLGVLQLTLGLVAGQIVTSVVLDQLLPAHGHPATVATYGGAALAVVAVAIAAFGGGLGWGGRRPGPGDAG